MTPVTGSRLFSRLHLGGERLVLASRSPRRAALLELVGADFEVLVPVEEEPPPPPGFPHAVVQALASHKALAVSAAQPKRWVLGADTLVWRGGEVLGKPGDPVGARRMLQALSGGWHEVFTGICLAREGRSWQAWERSRVRFRTLNDYLINSYIETQEPFDKAGAYGIQGYGAMLVDRIEGCYFNVMGLPLARLAQLFERAAGPQKR